MGWSNEGLQGGGWGFWGAMHAYYKIQVKQTIKSFIIFV